jgi:hypothetical protein
MSFKKVLKTVVPIGHIGIRQTPQPWPLARPGSAVYKVWGKILDACASNFPILMKKNSAAPRFKFKPAEGGPTPTFSSAATACAPLLVPFRVLARL